MWATCIRVLQRRCTPVSLFPRNKCLRFAIDFAIARGPESAAVLFWLSILELPNHLRVGFKEPMLLVKS